MALHDAFAKLEALDPRQARVIELRLLIGLSVEETGKVLGIRRTTVITEFKSGRAFLRRELEGAL
jgi:DNA-directed RNA polymerase specialized sigma24 family protein